MKLNYVGSIDAIKKDGDFAYRMVGGEPVELWRWCPGHRGNGSQCVTPVHRAPARDETADTPRTWELTGPLECPTISPSIGCDDRATRCGRHVVITNGVQ